MSRLSDEVLQATIDAYVACGHNQRATARRLGVNYTTIVNRLARARTLGMTVPEPDVGPNVAPQSSVDELSPEARRMRRLEAELRASRDALRRALERLDTLEDVRAGVFNLRDSMASGEPLGWVTSSVRSGDHTVLVPCLLTTDQQVGEVIRADELDGINSYDMEEFSRRYMLMIEKLFEISDRWFDRAEIPYMVYLRGGDAISGHIHLELDRTNDLSAAPAIRWLLQHESEGIARCAERYGHVLVISIPGNHGRVDIKPTSKGYVERNFETILSLWLEDHFRQDPRIQFVLPASGDAYVDILGNKVVLSHGDRIGSRGGMGEIGPILTIARGHKKVWNNWTRTGRRVDYVMTGHFHTSVRTNYGYGGGSIVGYNQFANSHRFTPEPASQLLTFFHEKYGVAAEFNLQLSPKPRRETVNMHF